MTQREKATIREHLADYCQRKGSQNKAAKSMHAVSSGTISQILNGNWDLVTDEMFRKIASVCGGEREEEKQWKIVATRGYKRMVGLLEDARQSSLVFAVIGEAGSGKSGAIASYTSQNKNVYSLSCSEYWNRKLFLEELAREMALSGVGCTVGEMMREIIYNLKKQDIPLIVLDQADKLSDQVLYFFISLYNQLEDRCGIVLSATDFLAKRIKKGVRVNRKGYKEIYSRCGRKFIPLQEVNATDIAGVCKANGVEESEEIKRIVEESEGDLRRVKRRIYATKQQRARQEQDKEEA